MVNYEKILCMAYRLGVSVEEKPSTSISYGNLWKMIKGPKIIGLLSRNFLAAYNVPALLTTVVQYNK